MTRIWMAVAVAGLAAVKIAPASAENTHRVAERRAQMGRIVAMVNATGAALVTAIQDSTYELVLPKHVVTAAGGRGLRIRFHDEPAREVNAVLRDSLTNMDLASVYVLRRDLPGVILRESDLIAVSRPSDVRGMVNMMALGHPNGDPWIWVTGVKATGVSDGAVQFQWGPNSPPVVRGFSGGVLVTSDWNIAGLIVEESSTSGVAFTGRRIIDAVKDRGWPVQLKERPERDWFGRVLTGGTLLAAAAAIAETVRLHGINEELDGFSRANREEIMEFNARVADGSSIEQRRDTLRLIAACGTVAILVKALIHGGGEDQPTSTLSSTDR